MVKYSIPRQLWRAIYPILLFFAISVLVIATVVIIFSLNFAFETSASGDMPAQSSINEHISSFLSTYGMLTQLLSTTACLFAFLIMWHKTRSGLTYIKKYSLFAKHFLLLIGFSASLNIFLALILASTNVSRFFPSYDGVAEFMTSGNIFLRVFALGVLAPIVEELCCRGIVFNRLCSWMPSWLAIVVSSVLFGAMHLNFFQGLYAFFIGMVFCFLYARYHNILVPIIGHIAFNTANVVLVEIASTLGIDDNQFSALIPILLFAIVSGLCISVLLFHVKPTVTDISYENS